MGLDVARELNKALTAGYGTDVAALSGGGALRPQSLDGTMKSTIQANQHLRLFNQLQKNKAIATVDEWMEQSGVGGFPGSSATGEAGTIRQSTGVYARRVGMVKYLMDRRSVTFVQSLQNNLIDSIALEQANGAIKLLSDAEVFCFEGDASVVPTEFDGIEAQINGLGSNLHVMDMQAQSLVANGAITFFNAAATIAGFGNFGRASHVFWSPKTQADMDAVLTPSYRVPLPGVGNGGIDLGAPVTGIRTSQGDIATVSDVFIREEDQQMPFEVGYATFAAANTYTPVSAVPALPAANASSAFGAAHAGNYYYLVTGTSETGESTGIISAQVTVAAGDAVVLTITASASGAETGYVIYRSRKNGTNAVTDFRRIVRVPKSGATTVYTDLNRDIPGTTKAYLLSMSSGADAISWQQFLPMTKFPLYPTATAEIPWAQLLFGYLRLAKRRQHVVIKNILPNSATWLPFG